MPNEPQPAPQPDAGAELPTVSAVIPAYNAAATIERALRSVYDQTYPNLIEVIVVDDGSTDATAQIVRDKFPQVTLIRQENAGNAGARNTGVAAATGEYLAFLDADDEWLPEKTTVQVEALLRHPTFDLLLTASSSADVACDVVPTVINLSFRQFLWRGLPDGVMFCCSSWLVRSEAMREHGFEAGRKRAVDWEFLLRLTGQGYSVGAVLAPLYRYHVRPDSVSNSPAGLANLCRLDVEIVRRYDPAGDGWQSELLTPEEYRRALYEAYYGRAWHAWELGERALAREHLREARKLAPPGLASSLRHRLAAWQPGLYRALSRTRGR